jgi:hypothetical protein
MVHFDLDTVLSGVAGQTLFVELWTPHPDPTESSVVGWHGRRDDPYAQGHGELCYGADPSMRPIADPGLDFSFRALGAGDGGVCPQIRSRVPDAAVEWAVANQERVFGFGELRNPGLPAGPNNPRRLWLTLQQLSIPYNVNYNRLVYRAGCP